MLALAVHPVLRVGAAFGAEGLGVDLVLVLALLAVFFLDLPFDRKPVAVPARNVRRVTPKQRLRADDHVFQHVVERVADVHVAVRVGRAIVKDELFAAFPLGAEALVEIQPLPARKPFRLCIGESGLHREIGLRQEDGVAVVFTGIVVHIGHTP